MGVEITERCRLLRVIACEMSRIISHLVWAGTTGIDLDAITMTSPASGPAAAPHGTVAAATIRVTGASPPRP